MKLSTAVSFATSGRVQALRSLLALATEATRAHWLTSATRSGLFRALAPAPLEESALAAALGLPAGGALRAWLEVGASLGELQAHGGRWALSSRLARALAEEKNDDLAAILEEVTTLHAKLLHETPARLREARPFTLADQDGEIIARSSRVLEPLLEEVVAEHVPQAGPFRLLEVGCGSGVYLRFAAARNPELTALGLELQPEVAARARANLEGWGVGARVKVEAQDLRQRSPEPAYELVTLHNNIYYFPVAERVAVLRHAAGFLAPGGTLLVTTAVPGGSPTGAVLHLWGEATQGCGGLPEPEALCAQLREAGLEGVESRNVGAPVERFYAFVGRRG
jgi:4-hydroxy-2,2'-bipyrrole-5-carbaldehyde O-methyltransferase